MSGCDYDDHDETDSPPACCKSCGVPFVEHLGVQGCCAKLQAEKDTQKRTLREISSMLRDIGCRFGVAATPEYMRAEVERVARLLDSWSR